MTIAHMADVASSVLSTLVEAAARGAVVAAAAALFLALFRVTRPSTRLLALTMVVVAALAMPALTWTLPTWRWSVPIVTTSSHDETWGPTRTAPASIPAVPHADESPVNSLAKPAAPIADHWPATAIGLLVAYWIGVGILLARLVSGHRACQAVRTTATSLNLTTGTLAARAAHVASTLRVAPPSGILESGRVRVPLMIGFPRPTLVLPTDWREWDAVRLDAVLIHELSHVARRDVVTQRLALLYRALFWFSPAAWWLQRRIAELCEHASDEAVLQSGIERHVYAETLLLFLSRVSERSGRLTGQVAMATAAVRAERRIGQILRWTLPRRSRLTHALGVAALVLAASSALLAATVRVEELRNTAVAVMRPVATVTPIVTAAAAPSPGLVAKPARTQPVGASATPFAPTAPSLVGQQAGPLATQDVSGRRLWVLLFDMTLLTPQDMSRAVESATAWTETRMNQSDLVSVLAVGSRLVALQDFTNDTAKVESTLQRLLTTANDIRGSNVSAAAGTGNASASDEIDTFNNDVRLRAIRSICDGLRAATQEKHLRWYSAGLSREPGLANEVAAMERSCVSAHVTVETADARMRMADTNSADPSVVQDMSTTPGNSRFAQADIVLVDVVARDRSGQPVTDLRPAEVSVFEDGTERHVENFLSVPGSTHYYLLGYRATTASGAASFRKIEVRTTRPGVGLRWRGGYYAPDQDRFFDGTYPEGTPGLVDPVVIERREPAYTSEAIRAKIQGDAVIEAIVGVDGTVARVRVAQSLDSTFGLDDEALKAVRQWRFTPGELHGEKVQVLVRLVLAFRLH